MPVEVESCLPGSELSECTERLHLLRIHETTLRDDGSLPLAATWTERMQADDGDDGLTKIVGTSHGWRWEYTMVTPQCVRFESARSSATTFTRSAADSRSRRASSRTRASTTLYGARPETLPQRAAIPDVYGKPDDLRGLWRLDGDQWIRVDRCPPDSTSGIGVPTSEFVTACAGARACRRADAA